MTAAAKPDPIPDIYPRVTPCPVVANHVEDVSQEAMGRRLAAMSAQPRGKE